MHGRLLWPLKRAAPHPGANPVRRPSSSTGPSGRGIETLDSARRIGSARAVVLALATAGGAGFAPIAPGTFGAAVGVLLFLPFSALGAPLYALTWVALTCVAVWAADAAEVVFAQRDDGRIVIDEVVGQLVSLAPLLGTGLTRSWPALVTGFVVFRVFDIWKPGPVRWLEQRLSGGLGVVLDDVAAGVLTAIVLAVGVLLFEARG